jgi:hypothetical protein
MGMGRITHGLTSEARDYYTDVDRQMELIDES